MHSNIVGTNDRRLLRTKLTSIVLLFFYYAVRFGGERILDTVWSYASYVFELGFVILVLVLFRKRYSRRVLGPIAMLITVTLSGASGFGVYKLIRFLGVHVPFDLNAAEVLLFIIGIGPILEELIFRGALWELFLVLTKSNCGALTLSTLAFSFGHFYAFWHVPTEFKNFVIYQTIYTVALGAGCGLARLRTEGLVVPIIIHGLFNIGFVLGAFR